MKEIENNATLTVWAHADDSAWTAGGSIAQLTTSTRVDGLLFTDSNGQGLGPQRLEEERAAMKVLGMETLYPVGHDHHFEDGRLANEHFGPMVTALLHVIDSAKENGVNYHTIITFGPDGYSGHFDHMVVAHVVLETFRLRNQLKSIWQVGMSAEEREAWGDYFVPIPVVDTKDYHAVPIEATYKQKNAAIASHTSQLKNGGLSHIARVEKLPKKEYFKITNRL